MSDFLAKTVVQKKYDAWETENNDRSECDSAREAYNAAKAVYDIATAIAGSCECASDAAQEMQDEAAEIAEHCPKAGNKTLTQIKF